MLERPVEGRRTGGTCSGMHERSVTHDGRTGVRIMVATVAVWLRWQAVLGPSPETVSCRWSKRHQEAAAVPPRRSAAPWPPARTTVDGGAQTGLGSGLDLCSERCGCCCRRLCVLAASPALCGGAHSRRGGRGSSCADQLRGYRELVRRRGCGDGISAGAARSGVRVHDHDTSV